VKYIVIGPVCGWVCGCLFVCGSVTTITRNCVHRSSPNGFVGKGSDHLQLIKFWPPCAPGNGVCSGVNIFGSTLLQPACSVCISLSAFFVGFVVIVTVLIIIKSSPMLYYHHHLLCFSLFHHNVNDINFHKLICCSNFRHLIAGRQENKGVIGKLRDCSRLHQVAMM